MIKKLFKIVGGVLLAIGIVAIWLFISDRTETKENLALPAIADVRSVPGTVVLFGEIEGLPGLEHRQAEGTAYMRIIPVRLDGRHYTSWVLIPLHCAIPPPGTRVTVEEVRLNSRGPAIGFKGEENPGLITALECDPGRYWRER